MGALRVCRSQSSVPVVVQRKHLIVGSIFWANDSVCVWIKSYLHWLRRDNGFYTWTPEYTCWIRLHPHRHQTAAGRMYSTFKVCFFCFSAIHFHGSAVISCTGRLWKDLHFTLDRPWPLKMCSSCMSNTHCSLFLQVGKRLKGGSKVSFILYLPTPSSLRTWITVAVFTGDLVHVWIWMLIERRLQRANECGSSGCMVAWCQLSKAYTGEKARSACIFSHSWTNHTPYATCSLRSPF